MHRAPNPYLHLSTLMKRGDLITISCPTSSKFAHPDFLEERVQILLTLQVRLRDARGVDQTRSNQNLLHFTSGHGSTPCRLLSCWPLHSPGAIQSWSAYRSNEDLFEDLITLDRFWEHIFFLQCISSVAKITWKFSEKGTMPQLTLDPLFVPTFASQVWRTFSPTRSNSLTRLPIPGYLIQPRLTRLSSLALPNQFAPCQPLLLTNRKINPRSH